MSTPTKNRATGRGKSEKLPDGSTLLFNFDIDSSVLKPEHTAFLEQVVLKAAKASPGGLRVVIGGSADRLGDAAHNVALSNRRIQAVADFLKRKLPGYPWKFEGFGQGIGEDGATRAGDEDGTADEIFRNVIIEILKPGQPIPRKPNIPKSFPKKPGDFPRPKPKDESFNCLREDQISPGTSFDVRLQSSTPLLSAGIVLASLLIRDLKNQLEADYAFRAIDANPANLAINTAEVLQPRGFETPPAKVTDFSFATIKNGIARGELGAPATIELRFKAADGKSATVTASLDLGSQGKLAHLIAGPLSLQSRCQSGLGARKLDP